jgi:hypothetical protein
MIERLFPNFEISTPQITKKEISYFEKLDFESGALIFLKKPYDLLKQTRLLRFYEKMKNNFENETGDLTYERDPKLIYLFVTPLFTATHKISDQYRVIGVTNIGYNDTVDFIWFHPFFRGRGIMKIFLKWYSENESPLFLSPPISKSMKNCCEAMHKIADVDKVFDIRKKYLINRCPSLDEELQDLNNSDIHKIYESISRYNVMVKMIENDEEFTNIVSMILKAKKEFEKPTVLRNLQEEESFKKRMEDLNDEYKRKCSNFIF